jgi:CCR4-NOT transcription complex subunit 2
MSRESRYGLLGLLDVIKMTDRDLNTLALGSDLTTFGLNLSSADSLHLTFSSPFSDTIAPAEVPVFITPPCYMMQPPSMKPDHLSKMNIETLFYIFYSMPRDQLQTAAALELYRREWWFHVDLRLWMKLRAPPAVADPAAAQAAGQQQFVYFDSSTWEARIYTGPALRAGGFLSEEEIAMTPPKQQQQPPQPPVVGAQGLSGVPVGTSGGALGVGPGNFSR